MFKRFGLGFATGYVLGARNGEKHYEKLSSFVGKLKDLPAVQQLSDEGIGGLTDRTRDIVDRIRSVAGDMRGDGEDDEGEPEDQYDDESGDGEDDDEGEPEDQYDDESGDGEDEEDEDAQGRARHQGGSRGGERKRSDRRESPRRRSVAKVASSMLERGRVA